MQLFSFSEKMTLTQPFRKLLTDVRTEEQTDSPILHTNQVKQTLSMSVDQGQGYTYSSNFLAVASKARK